MSMSKKHYVAIALAIAELTTGRSKQDMECLAIRLSTEFKADNSGFDRARFIAACQAGVA